MMLTRLDNKVVINLDKCLKCGSIIELFKAPVKDTYSTESLIYDILHNSEMKIQFESFILLCPRCGEKTEGSTYHKLDEDELELLNSTPLKDILITVSA